MATVNQSLLALQAADTDLDACKQRIRALQAELADEHAIVAARHAIDAAKADLSVAAQATAEGERDLNSLATVIARLEKRLFDGSIHNVREADSVEEELAHRRVERSAAEDAVLAAMERVEVAQVRMAQAQADLDAAERARAQRAPVLKAEGREMMARARALQDRRDALAAAAPPKLLATYDYLRASAPPAVVTVHGGVCGACGVAVPTAMLQRIVSDEPARCLNCTRLLVDG